MLQLDAIEGLLQCHLRNENLLSSVENRLWRLECSKLGGRGIFAKCDIEKGEVIFIDKSLLRGPRCYDKYLPMCVNCFNSKSTLFPCDNGCGLPVCSDQCENSTAHANGECKYLRNLRPTCGTMWSVDLLKVVIPLRSLTLGAYQKDLIAVLQCHEGTRFGCDEMELLERNVANEIDRRDKEFMLRLCRVLDTNAFETAFAIDNNLTSLRGLYPLGAFLNHCCVPNARHYFNKNGLMIVKAAVSIAKGEEIKLSYTDFLWPTSLRWKYLKMTKSFECSCVRCSDPTELGSNLSVLKCSNAECCGNMFADDPLDSETSWTCQGCKRKIPLCQVNAIRSKVKAIANEVLKRTPNEIVNFIENEFIDLVPVTNYITSDLKFHVVSYYGRLEDLSWTDLTDEELQCKADYCNDLITILDRVTCGDRLILHELYCTKREQLQRKLVKQKAKTDAWYTKACVDLNKTMNEVRSILKDDIAAPDDLGAIDVKSALTITHDDCFE